MIFAKQIDFTCLSGTKNTAISKTSTKRKTCPATSKYQSLKPKSADVKFNFSQFNCSKMSNKLQPDTKDERTIKNKLSIYHDSSVPGPRSPNIIYTLVFQCFIHKTLNPCVVAVCCCSCKLVHH